MNKSMMFPIHKKWVDKIFNGRKKFEFRNKLPKHLVKGMKIYFYETLGKVVKEKYTIGPYAINMETQEEHYVGITLIPAIHEGQGMIVGEATVKDIWNISPGHYKHKGIFHVEFDNQTTSSFMISEKEMNKQGYTNQKFAIELTNVIKYDEEWIKSNFLKTVEECDNVKIKFSPSSQGAVYHCEELESSCVLSDNDDYYQECPLFEKYSEIPSSPIAKEEFILWNKYQIIKDDKEKYLSENPNVQFSPQAPIYVVEREVK